MYYILKFNLQKSEGRFPSKAEVLSVFPNSVYGQVLKESLKFSFHNDNNLLQVVNWKLVDDGMESLQLDGDEIEGYPLPIVWLHLKNEVDIEDADIWLDALSSEYVLKIERINMDEPYFFQDHNGYSKVESAEWLADEIWETLQETIADMEDDQMNKLTDDTVITRQRSVEDEGIILSAIIKIGNLDFIFRWFFESEEAIADFDFYNNEYSDSNGFAYAEENYMIYKIHRLICENDK